MFYIILNKKKYNVLNNLQIKQENSEVTFQDITVDFTNGTIVDIPYKYQEIKIYNNKDDIVFTGFVDAPNLGEMKNTSDIEGRELTITLLSPLKMATLRTVTIIGTMSIKNAISRILEPLVNDGFVIKEINITSGQVTLNYVLQTVEYCMNDIGYKRNIFWHINEKKEIFVNNIDMLFGKNIVKKITEEDGEKEGLYYLQPTINDVDYANIINFKNVRLIYSTMVDITDYPIVEANKTIKKGDTITFKNPIILSENYLRNYISERNFEETDYYDIQLLAVCTDGTLKTYYSKIPLYDKTDANYNKYVNTNNFSYNDDGGDEKEVVFQRDSFYSNLITGFKWNVESNAELIVIRSDLTLRYTTMRFMYSNEIERLKGIISESGQIEKTIDYKEKWISLAQLISYARSLMTQNSNVINQVVLKYTQNPNLEIGDIVSITKPSFFTDGIFAVKGKLYTYNNENDEEWQITLKSSDLISSYIDMFRPTEQQENEENSDGVIVSEFIEEGINEIHAMQDYVDLETQIINLAKKAWGDVDGYVFSIQAEISTDYYAVAVRDPETSANVGWVYVNIATGECEVE